VPKIAISYRRTESDAAGRIYDRLAQRYGDESIFRDIDTIPFGVDFRRAVDEALADADVLIAIVGPQWRGINEDGSARITEVNDLVRIEIETALKRDIPLIPVLIGAALMPKATEIPESIRDFSFRNAAHIDSGRNFNTDVERLMRSIDRHREAKEQGEAQAKQEAALKEEAEKERKRREEEKRRTEAQQQADEERTRREAAEAEKRAEEVRRARETEARARAEAEARQQAEDETRRLEDEAKQRAEEEEARRQAQAEDETRRLEDETKQRPEEEEARRQAQAEAKRAGHPLLFSKLLFNVRKGKAQEIARSLGRILPPLVIAAAVATVGFWIYQLITPQAGLFRIEANIEAKGNSTSSAASSRTDCEENCAREPNCKAFTYNKAYQRCFGFSGEFSRTSNRAYDTGIRNK
jgi:hypothetical protein